MRNLPKNFGITFAENLRLLFKTKICIKNKAVYETVVETKMFKRVS